MSMLVMLPVYLCRGLIALWWVKMSWNRLKTYGAQTHTETAMARAKLNGNNNPDLDRPCAWRGSAAHTMFLAPNIYSDCTTIPSVTRPVTAMQYCLSFTWAVSHYTTYTAVLRNCTQSVNHYTALQHGPSLTHSPTLPGCNSGCNDPTAHYQVLCFQGSHRKPRFICHIKFDVVSMPNKLRTPLETKNIGFHWNSIIYNSRGAFELSLEISRPKSCQCDQLRRFGCVRVRLHLRK